MEAIFLFLISFCFLENQITEQSGIECPSLPIVDFPNGKIELFQDDGFEFSCDKDFHLIGPSVLRCFRGNWSSSILPKCRRSVNSCSPPKPIAHGTILGDSWNVGDEIIYFCNDKYRLMGSGTRKCLRSRHWDGIQPFCQDVNEPLTKLAGRMKSEFITKVGEYSDTRSRAIGTEIRGIGLELILLIDRSSSVDPADFKIGIDFAKYMIETFGAKNGNIDEVGTGTRVAFITFGDKAEITINVNDGKVKSKQDAKNILDGLEPGGGGTAMEAALSIIPGRVSPLLRPKAKKVIFLLTDGHNNVGITPPREVAKILKENLDFEIYTVGIGQDINKVELVEIASSPQNNHVFLLNKYEDLKDILWLIQHKEPPKDQKSKLKKCGVLAKTNDGKRPEAVPNWPWLASIFVSFSTENGDKKMGICAGSLICNRWVLTSASCFYGEDKKNVMRHTKNVFVTLGDRHLLKIEETESNYYAVNVRIHPKFDRSIGGNHDLALLKLNKEVPLQDIYKAICLPRFDMLFDNLENFALIGWGNKPNENFFKTHFASSFKTQPTEVYLPKTRDIACDAIKPRITDNLFCAGSIDNRTCAGSLGSPLVKKDSSNVHYLLGVLVERKSCSTHFNLFIGVKEYRSWINNVTGSCPENIVL